MSLSEEKRMSDWDKNTVLKILTLNIAHGRKDGPNQIFQGTERIKSNLDDIVSLLQRESPDLVAIQEADSHSAWNGNFNHVAYLAEKSGYSYSVLGIHIDGMMLSYGTALLSKYPLIKPVSVTFRPSPPTFPKGFVSACINITEESEIEIISVHFDFLSNIVREKQAQDMIDMLSASRKPLIIMGDFNCEWEKDSPLQMLAVKLNLSAYRADADNIITFPSLEKRLDWILISHEFEFITYKVIPDIVSDHLGVISEIRIKDND